MPSLIHPEHIKSNARLGKKGVLRRALTVFPLLSIPILIYILMSIMAGKPDDPAFPSVQSSLDYTLFSLPMLSGVKWQLRSADLLLLLALLMLAIEIVKSTSTKSGAIVSARRDFGVE